MSGHSKWSTIKRQKGTADVKRGNLFTKLASAITIAVRSGGGGDMDSNFKLRLAVDRARASNMPKDIISRAIERGMGLGDKGDFNEAIYEGFGPGGIAVIVEAATDNKARTIQEIKNVFDRGGGTLASPGAVSYQFDKKGLIIIGKNDKSFDDIFLIAADLGAEDVEDSDQEVHIYTKTEDLKKIKDELGGQGFLISDAALTWKAKTSVVVADSSQSEKIVNFLSKMEELDDVQTVSSNAEFNIG